MNAAILVIEDHELVARMLTRFLASAGFSTEVASTAQRAIAMASSAMAIDAIISDVELPDGDGPSAVAAIIVRRPTLRGRVIYVSGAPHRVREVRAMGHTCFEKPFVSRDLLAALNAILVAPS